LNDKKRRRKINEIIEREEGIAMTSELLKRISRDHAERLLDLSEEKYQLDMQSRMTNAVNKGREQGRQQGREQGRQEERQEIFKLIKSGKSLEEIEMLRSEAN
jgi:flagellar biosynthesis/type III secretory pathway protein FliH